MLRGSRFAAVFGRGRDRVPLDDGVRLGRGEGDGGAEVEERNPVGVLDEAVAGGGAVAGLGIGVFEADPEGSSGSWQIEW